MNFIEQWQERRMEIVEKYRKGLKEIDGITLPKILKGHAKHLYVIQLITEKWTIDRNQFIEEMIKRGIGLAVHYKPINQLSYYVNRYNINKNNYPNANSLFDSIVTLPLYPILQDSDVDYICKNISDIYKKHTK
jgi:Predicted pyridoxal phosphate-dependent enzyme apparently involved in regulation of cell wall biogenesis